MSPTGPGLDRNTCGLQPGPDPCLGGGMLPRDQVRDAVGDGLRVAPGSVCGGRGDGPGVGLVGGGLGGDRAFGGGAKRAGMRRMAGSLWWPIRIG